MDKKDVKDLLEKVSDSMGIKETIRCDRIVKWDGSKLYVTEETFRGELKSGERQRDVTSEIAERLKQASVA